jgi:hypothetical protein
MDFQTSLIPIWVHHGLKKTTLQNGVLLKAFINFSLLNYYSCSFHRTAILSCAFLDAETTEAFCWFFDTCSEMMEGQPQVCFTDRDAACSSAMKTSWPCTKHYCCEWHLDKNLMENLSSPLGIEGFKVGDFLNSVSVCHVLSVVQ